MFHDVLMILLTRFRESRLLSGGGWHGLPQHCLQRQSSVCSHGPGSLCLSTGGASCAIKVKPPARVSVVPLVYHSGSCEYVWVLNGLTQFNILEHNICHIVLHYNIYIYIYQVLFVCCARWDSSAWSWWMKCRKPWRPWCGATTQLLRDAFLQRSWEAQHNILYDII